MLSTLYVPTKTGLITIIYDRYPSGAVSLSISTPTDEVIPVTVHTPWLTLGDDEVVPKLWGAAKPYTEELIEKGVIVLTETPVSVGFATTQVAKLGPGYAFSVPAKSPDTLAAEHLKLQAAVRNLANLADGGASAHKAILLESVEQDMREINASILGELDQAVAGREYQKALNDDLSIKQAKLEAELENVHGSHTEAMNKVVLSLNTSRIEASALAERVSELELAATQALADNESMAAKLLASETARQSALGLFESAVNTLKSGGATGVTAFPALPTLQDRAEVEILQAKLAESELALSSANKLLKGMSSEYSRLKMERGLSTGIPLLTEEIPDFCFGQNAEITETA